MNKNTVKKNTAIITLSILMTEASWTSLIAANAR